MSLCMLRVFTFHLRSLFYIFHLNENLIFKMKMLLYSIFGVIGYYVTYSINQTPEFLVTQLLEISLLCASACTLLRDMHGSQASSDLHRENAIWHTMKHCL